MPRLDVRKLANLAGSEFSVVGYRRQARGFDPRSGDGARRAGGRFNLPHSFPVIYLCTSQPCVVAELTRQADRQRLAVDDLLPRELWRITVELNKVLNLTNRQTLVSLDVDPRDLIRDDLEFTREIGEAAHEHGFQAICPASATGVDAVVGIMPENLAGAVMRAEFVTEWRTAIELP